MSQNVITNTVSFIQSALATLQSKTEEAAINWSDPKFSELRESISEIVQKAQKVYDSGDKAHRDFELFIKISEENC